MLTGHRSSTSNRLFPTLTAGDTGPAGLSRRGNASGKKSEQQVQVAHKRHACVPSIPFLLPGPAVVFRLLTRCCWSFPFHPAQTEPSPSIPPTMSTIPPRATAFAWPTHVNAPFVCLLHLRAAVEEANSLPGTDLIVCRRGLFSHPWFREEPAQPAILILRFLCLVGAELGSNLH